MTTRETLLLAALIVTILFHVFSTELALRTDWINFGSDYRNNQQAIVQEIGRIANDVKGLNSLIGELKSESAGKNKK